jgi:hypothetical protein
VIKGDDILCPKCRVLAGSAPIHVLMHKDVCTLFSITYKNQLYVTLDLRKASNKPDSKKDSDERIRLVKKSLIDTLNGYSLVKLKKVHDEVNLKVWDILVKKHKGNEYSLRYFTIREIVNKFSFYSGKK